MKTKLEMFKTAFSPMYNCYVGIVSVHYDDTGKAIIKARLCNEDTTILFREHELINYVL